MKTNKLTNFFKTKYFRLFIVLIIIALIMTGVSFGIMAIINAIKQKCPPGQTAISGTCYNDKCSDNCKNDTPGSTRIIDNNNAPNCGDCSCPKDSSPQTQPDGTKVCVPNCGDDECKAGEECIFLNNKQHCVNKNDFKKENSCSERTDIPSYCEKPYICETTANGKECIDKSGDVGTCSKKDNQVMPCTSKSGCSSGTCNIDSDSEISPFFNLSRKNYNEPYLGTCDDRRGPIVYCSIEDQISINKRGDIAICDTDLHPAVNSDTGCCDNTPCPTTGLCPSDDDACTSSGTVCNKGNIYDTNDPKNPTKCCSNLVYMNIDKSDTRICATGANIQNSVGNTCTNNNQCTKNQQQCINIIKPDGTQEPDFSCRYVCKEDEFAGPNGCIKANSCDWNESISLTPGVGKTTTGKKHGTNFNVCTNDKGADVWHSSEQSGDTYTVQSKLNSGINSDCQNMTRSQAQESCLQLVSKNELIDIKDTSNVQMTPNTNGSWDCSLNLNCEKLSTKLNCDPSQNSECTWGNQQLPLDDVGAIWNRDGTFDKSKGTIPSLLPGFPKSQSKSLQYLSNGYACQYGSFDGRNCNNSDTETSTLQLCPLKTTTFKYGDNMECDFPLNWSCTSANCCGTNGAIFTVPNSNVAVCGCDAFYKRNAPLNSPLNTDCILDTVPLLELNGKLVMAQGDVVNIVGNPNNKKILTLKPATPLSSKTPIINTIVIYQEYILKGEKMIGTKKYVNLPIQNGTTDIPDMTNQLTLTTGDKLLNVFQTYALPNHVGVVGHINNCLAFMDKNGAVQKVVNMTTKSGHYTNAKIIGNSNIVYQKDNKVSGTVITPVVGKILDKGPEEFIALFSANMDYEKSVWNAHANRTETEVWIGNENGSDENWGILAKADKSGNLNANFAHKTSESGHLFDGSQKFNIEPNNGPTTSVFKLEFAIQEGQDYLIKDSGFTAKNLIDNQFGKNAKPLSIDKILSLRTDNYTTSTL